MKKTVIKFIDYYQKNISPFKKPCCRFVPTCSSYAKEAFQKYGFIKAFLLSFFRFLRCNPLFKGGFDPVP